MANNALHFEALSPADAGGLAAILALGMCIAVRERAVTPQYACDKLFRPSLVQKLRVLGVDSAVCESISEALEIEDVADLAEAGLRPLLDRIVAILTGFLNDTQWQCLADRTSWLR